MSIHTEFKNIATLAENIDHPHVDCSCGRVVKDDGNVNIFCTCGKHLIHREPITKPCSDCGGKFTCHCITGED